MHPRTDELLRHLDLNRAALRAAIDAVPLERRETRPDPERWSVAEVLEHLSRIEERLTSVLSARLGEARDQGLEPERDTSSVVDTIDNAAVLDRRRRITAGEGVRPRGELDAAAAWAALEQARDKLRNLIIEYDGLALAAVTHPHPILGVFNANQWFAFVGTHEARHVAQVREIASALRAR